MNENRPTDMETGTEVSDAAPAAAALRDPAFDELYETYVPLLHAIAIRKFGIPHADVEELVHDVFATYLTHASRVRQVRPYLIGGICNASRQYWREAEAERKVFCDADPAAASVEDEVLEPLIRNTVLAAALTRLGPSCRETLHRFYVDGESAISIAASRSTTPNTIHQLLSYCRTRLRAAYRKMWEEA